MKELISKGTFMAFENRVYLAGACNVGKSTLASILLGEEIPQRWKSTDGLIIYFGSWYCLTIHLSRVKLHYLFSMESLFCLSNLSHFFQSK
jgi:Fe-S cluster assembly ATPase SufC